MPTNDGWEWFDGAPARNSDEASITRIDADLADAFAKCFRGADADQVLKYLRAITIERSCGVGASEGLLRHVEGQRQLVFHIESLIERGRNGA